MSQESIRDKTFSLSLPVGLLDDRGTLHKQGLMRLATGKDELGLLQDPRSDYPGYGVLVMLSRVLICLGNLSPITPDVLEGLFLPDLQYLQEFYNQVNPGEAAISTLGEL